jgi:hypothetical protein
MTASKVFDGATLNSAARSRSALKTRRDSWETCRYRSALILCGGAALFCLGQFAGAVQKGEKLFRADRIVAGSFELSSPSGKPAALLRTNDRGEASLSFYDEKQATRINLGLSGGRPVIRLFDAQAEMKLSLFVDAEGGTPSLLLKGHGPRDCRSLLAVGDHGPRMSFVDDERGRLSMGLNDRGQPTMVLHGTGNARGVALSVSEDGSTISLTGKDGIRKANWSLLPDGSPVIQIADHTGRITLEITVDEDGKPAVQKFGPK